MRELKQVFSTTWRRDLAALALLFGICLVWLWPVTFGGRLLIPADMLMVMQPWKAHSREMGFERVQNPFLDAIQQHYPWRKFAAEQFREGTVPLWNPYMFCGMPFVANNQSACFYPETWLFRFMAPERAFGWAALISLTLGSWFMYFFLRAWSLRRVACVAGSIPFMLSGFIVGWLMLPTVRAVPMWLPLILLAYELGLRRRPWLWLPVCALAVGMQFLAGHLHVSVFVLLITLAYMIFRAVQVAVERGWQRGAAALAPGLGALAVGTALAAIQLLPVLELVGMNPRRGDIDYAAIMGNAMVPAYLLAGLMPDLFGNPVDYNFWGWQLFSTRREYIETVWYCGIPLLVLIGAAAGRGRSAQVWFWLGLWVLGVALAWGTGLNRVLMEIAPPLKQLTGISRAVFISCFAGAVLAAWGMDALLRHAQQPDAERARRAAMGTGAGIAVVALVGGLGTWFYTGAFEDVLPGIGTYTLVQIGRCLALVALTIGALTILKQRPVVFAAAFVVIMAADLLYFAGKFTPAVPADYLQVRTDVLTRLAAQPEPFRMTSLAGEERGIDRMSPNLPMAFGFEDVQGSDSLVFDGYNNLLALVPRDRHDNPDPQSPVMRLLNCRYVLTSLPLDERDGYQRLVSRETGLFLSEKALSRAFLPAKVDWVASDAEALSAVAKMDDPAVQAVATGEPRVMADEPFVKVSSFRRLSPNIMAMSADPPLSAQRLLVVSEIAYPGWQVWVDGAAQPLVRAYYALTAVYLDRPAREVRFVYYPASFVVGAFLTGLALMILLCIVTAGWIRTLSITGQARHDKQQRRDIDGGDEGAR